MEGVVSVADLLFDGAFAGRRVFITGHTGFKGSWLAEWLLGMGAIVAGYSLEPPTEPSLFDELGLANRLSHEVGDVRDASSLSRYMREFDPEIVFHLAAQPLVRLSYEEPVATYETNVMGTVNVLEAIRTCPSVRVAIVVTSDKCYENRETGQAYREDDCLGGFDPYSSSKGCAELVTAAYRRSFFGPESPVRIASARAGNVIGGGDWALDRIVPDCVRALEADTPILVRNPDAVRPWQHVLEPLSGYLQLASRLWSQGAELDGAWNFGPLSQDDVPVREIVDSIIAEWGSGSWETPSGKPDGPHEARLLALDITKARERLGWEPLYTTQKSCAATAAWYGARHKGADAGEMTRSDIDAYVSEAVARGAAWASDVREQGL
ncbi:MAG: CDP-glucose 4,6-dehydratase [Coriobacteriia bacterium]